MSTPDFRITNLAKNCNEALIIAVLSEEKKHGYQLALEIEEKSQGYFTFNHGTLYPILHKLENGGIIKGSWKQEGPKRKRKYYTLTSKGKNYGKEQLGAWLKFFNHFLDIVEEIRK